MHNVTDRTGCVNQALQDQQLRSWPVWAR
jgi:hypothetical protein